MSLLKQLSEQLARWDEQIEQHRGEASKLAGDARAEAEKTVAELRARAEHIKAQVEELASKDRDELTNEAKTRLEELGRLASGELGKGLENLAAFFKGKANKPGDTA